MILIRTVKKYDILGSQYYGMMLHRSTLVLYIFIFHIGAVASLAGNCILNYLLLKLDHSEMRSVAR